MSVPVSSEPSFWRIVAQSLRGEHHDFTAVSLNRAVLLLAVPMVLEMIMESVFAVVNVFWVSRLGSDAIAVVGLTESVMTPLYTVAMGLSIAATAFVSRRIGEKNPERAAQAAGQIIVLGVAVSAGMGALLSFFAVDLLRLMGASEAVVSLGANFARIMLGCNVTVFMIFLINAIFRGAGDAVLAMRTLWLANALNILLGPCFIFGWGPFPEMGVTGAAVATNAGRGIGVLYQLWHLAGLTSRVHIRLRHLKLVSADVRAIMATAWNGMAQMVIGSTSWIGLIKILAEFGSAAIASYTIAMRILAFALLPAFGLANAGATLVGQNLGAGQPARAEQAVRIAMRFNVIFLGVVGVFFVMLSWPLVGVFTEDPQVLEQGARALWIISLALPLYAVGMCFGSAFNGAGDTWTPTRLNFYCLWLGQMPLAWVLAKTMAFGPVGVYVAVLVSSSALAVWNSVLFRRGRWKTQKV